MINFDLETAQSFFDTDFDELLNTPENEVDFISQSHSGDMLIETTETENNDRFKLWKNLDENGGEIEVEFSGSVNGWTWETIYRQESEF